MLRKLLLAAAALVAGAVFASTASAHDPRDNRDDFRRGSDYRRDDHDRGRFVVLVRHRLHWHEHGTYRDRDDAERAARRLERQGHDARIQRAGGWGF